jgi:hypothetical protein
VVIRIFFSFEDLNRSLEVVLNQTLVLLIELCNHPKEGVARIGCACFRHLTETVGPHLLPASASSAHGTAACCRWWDLVVSALFRALALTARPVTTMIRAFKPASTAFYGDVGQIKVVARRDSSLAENARLRRLTTQVCDKKCDENDYRVLRSRFFHERVAMVTNISCVTS